MKVLATASHGTIQLISQPDICTARLRPDFSMLKNKKRVLQRTHLVRKNFVAHATIPRH